MLKIKNDVTQQQLEEIGFTYYCGWYYKVYNVKKYKSDVDRKEHKIHPQLNYIEVRIWKNRQIYFEYVYDDEYLKNKGHFFRKQDYDYGLDIIYDLIQSGFVEKVEVSSVKN